MTRKDAIDRLDIIVSKHEVDDVYITLTNEKDYEALKVAINSLRIDEQYELEYEQAEQKSPCDVCRYNPPGSEDCKPCTICPACGRK